MWRSCTPTSGLKLVGFKGAMTRPTHVEVQAGHDFNNRMSLVHIFFQLGRAEVWYLSACASTVTVGTCVTCGMDIRLPNVRRGGSRPGSGRPGTRVLLRSTHKRRMYIVCTT